MYTKCTAFSCGDSDVSVSNRVRSSPSSADPQRASVPRGGGSMTLTMRWLLFPPIREYLHTSYLVYLVQRPLSRRGRDRQGILFLFPLPLFCPRESCVSIQLNDASPSNLGIRTFQLRPSNLQALTIHNRPAGAPSRYCATVRPSESSQPCTDEPGGPSTASHLPLEGI
ncbi:hypothetical protein LX36DRAFT_30068 [Colletotrichum falcatum]|nr:hypothetical protein LX36DRAFT_30068 [Colletotrichum falcatum]